MLYDHPVFNHACVAQLAEQLTRNEQVAGSNPATSSRLLAGDARSFSMYKSDDKRYAASMKNAEASVRMEGCQVTPQMREQCQRVLRGEVTTAELLRRGAQGAGQFSEADKLKKRMAAWPSSFLCVTAGIRIPDRTY